MENNRWKARGKRPKNRVAVLMIATGPECITYIPPLLESLRQHFPAHDAYVFTDSTEPLSAIKFYHPHTGWPEVTLRRFHAALSQRDTLLLYDYVMFLDTDMLACSPMTVEELFGEGTTSVVHPCYPDCFERRPESEACVTGNPTYYQGCLAGGSTAAFIAMCEAITKGIDKDKENGITAVWFEESHMNRYLSEHPPVRSLSPSYAFPILGCLVRPETWLGNTDPVTYTPKIRHLHKTWKK